MTAGGGAVVAGQAASASASASASAAGGPRRRLRTKVRVDASRPSASGQTSASSSVNTGPFVVKERHNDYVIVESALDGELLERLEKFLKRKRPQPAKMKNEGGDSDDERKARYNDRDSLVSWFTACDECPWLHDRLAEVVRHVGNTHWPLLKVDARGELVCEYEQTQYAVYGASQHFKAWHQDAYEQGNDPEDSRQFTIVAMLSRRSDYTGGSFQVKLPAGSVPKGTKKVIKSLSLDAGDFVVFPAKRLEHRVTAVKTGIRKTLVFWAFDKASCRFHAGSGAAAEGAAVPPAAAGA